MTLQMRRYFIAAAVMLLSTLTVLPAMMEFWGPGYIGDARAVGIAPNGDVWVGASGKIVVFDAQGLLVREIPQRGQVNSILFDNRGKPVIGYNDGVCTIYRGDELIHVAMFGQYSPWEVAVDSDGFLYASDGGKNAVKKIDVSGTLPREVATYRGPEEAPTVRPYSLCLDAQRRVYVTDESQPGVWIFDNEGKFLRRVLQTTPCWRIRARPDGIYVVNDATITVIKPETGETVRTVQIPVGRHQAMGFAIDSAGNFFLGSFYEGLVKKFSADAEPRQVMGPSYRARLTLPESWSPGAAVRVPLELMPIASNPAGTLPPVFSFTLQPTALRSEPDSNYANLQGHAPGPPWQTARTAQLLAQQRLLPAVVEENALLLTMPETVTPHLYRLLVQAEHGAQQGIREQALAIRVASPGATSNLTLFIPRNRTVFQQGERLELNAILRSATPLEAGTLRFYLLPRKDASLEFAPGGKLWGNFAVPPTSGRTLTFEADSAGFHPGRYLIAAEYISGNIILRDTWPLQIVTAVLPTNFRILHPQWSAGYTDIWGIFTGQGMMADAAAVAREGITLYDTTIGSRNQSPPLHAIGEEAQAAPALMAQAAAEPSLPAPERFLPANPLEIELQEALRNGLSVQRDIWGSHFLQNWGMAHPLGVPRDNRVVRLWTQWQREWPSWIGHRYLTLSIDEGENPERVALKQALQREQGLQIPTDAELRWLRNGPQRSYISDAPAPVTLEYAGIGADAAGNVYLASRGGVLLKYRADGILERSSTIPGELIDIAVAPDGTVYGAHISGNVSVTTPQGQTRSWPARGFSSHSPRGICLEAAGTLLVSDEGAGRVVRFTAEGEEVLVFADNRNLQRPAGLTVFADGTVAVLDGARGGVMLFNADGTPLRFLPEAGSHTAGGKGDLVAVPGATTFWATMGWGAVRHVDRDGNVLATIGRSTFAPGGMSLPMSVALTPQGNVLVSDVALPFAQSFSPAGEPLAMFGLNSLLADVRIDRQRYLWSERIMATVWMPVQGQGGDDRSILHAFARQGDVPWTPLTVEAYSGGDFALAVPRFTGDVALRLVWAPPGATADESLHADFSIQLSNALSAADEQRATDISQRQLAWTRAWAKTRMGTLTRWTELADDIRPGTQNTAPTNYGTPDSLAEGVWVPWRRDAVVAECENVGHDHGSFPLQGPWYVARALQGPDPRPAWSSLLQWYWNTPDTLQRPTRDTVLLLGAGASGIGTGTLTTRMTEPQLAVHRKLVQRLRSAGEASQALELPGKGGVAILHSFTQESIDPYMEEHFYTAHAAWYDLLRAHVPVAVTSEESIAQDGLIGRFAAVLLPAIQLPLPADTMAGLERFRRAGGEIWVDLGTRIVVPGAKVLRTRYRAFWAQDAYYWMHHGYGVGAYDGNYEYWRMKQGSDLRMPAVREAFSKYARMSIASSDANVFLQERHGGQARYIYASNDHFPDLPLYKTWLAGQTPVPAKVVFTAQGEAIYDALTMQRVPPGELTVDFTSEEPARIWAVLPSPIAAVSARASLQADRLYVTVQVNDAR